MEASNAVNAEEEAVFDRQMRLWGADAQQKIRASRVLVRGAFQGLASELCKNLVLAGVNVTIHDESLVQDEDVYSNIFLRSADVGKPRAQCALERLQEMNPFADVKLMTKNQPLGDFKLVVSIGESFQTIENIDEECRKHNVPFLAARCSGTLAFALLDLGDEYTYMRDGKNNEVSKVSYPPLKDVLQFSKWEELPKGRTAFPFGIFAIWICRQLEDDGSGGNKRPKMLSAEEIVHAHNGSGAVKNVENVLKAVEIFQRSSSFAPVCTVNGGLIGQEVLKIVSGQGEPLNNVMFFDGMDASASVRRVPPTKSS